MIETLRTTVVLVVRNGERYLEEAIKSVQAQSYRPHEIILIDGQSTDNTVQIAHAFPSIRYIRQTHLGLANARNIGISAATGQLIAFLDHDDIWAENKLEAQVTYLMRHPDIAYSITRMTFFLDPGATKPRRLDAASFYEARDGSTPSALVVRKTLFSELGGFNPSFKIGCDADWFVRARDYQVPAAVIPEVLLFKRIHEVNLSANVDVNRREMFQIAKQSIDRQSRLSHASATGDETV